jgi:CheY-like chemotaxis protein
MPGMDGLDVSKKIQESKLRTKIIPYPCIKKSVPFSKKKQIEYGIYGATF